MYIQKRAKTVNTLFPAHWMLMSYEDTLSNFPNRKSNKTILIIKDVAIYSFQSNISNNISNILSFLFLQAGPGGTRQSLVVWIEPETTKGAVGSKLFSDFIG